MCSFHHSCVRASSSHACGDVPVVVDVVVVEDHHRRDGGEQPADRGLAPALEVELRVVLEVEHALAGRLGRVAPRLDERARGRATPRRRRPGRRASAARRASSSRGSSRMRSASVWSASISRPRSSSSFVSEYGGSCGAATRQEPNAIWSGVVLRVGVERARREAVVARPDALAVEQHLVLVPAAALEVAAADERVVVAAHAEGALARAEDLDLAGGVGLDPEHGLGLADVSEQGSEHERGHAGRYPGE